MKPYNHDIYLNGYKAVTFEGPLRLGTYDSYGNERIRVLCSPEWDGLTIVATFKAASAVEVLVDADGMLDVPPEATATQQAAAGRCALTFVGTGEGRQVISCTTYYLVQDHATVGNVTPDPTPDKWQQFVDQVLANYTGAAAAAKEAPAVRRTPRRQKATPRTARIMQRPAQRLRLEAPMTLPD